MAKNKSRKLPKRIAGYKIPKKVRRQASPLLRMLDTPQLKGLLGAAMAAGAAVLADQMSAEKKKHLKKKAMRRVRFLAEEGRERATEIAESVGRAVGEAISSHLPGKSAKEASGAMPTAH